MAVYTETKTYHTKAHMGMIDVTEDFRHAVEEAARQAGVSRSCLYRAFQAEFGCSPSAYLIRYRIQRAAQLLRHSTLPISAVAASVGFEDPLYFSRAFRRAVGQSPTEYRQQNGPRNG